LAPQLLQKRAAGAFVSPQLGHRTSTTLISLSVPRGRESDKP
jgi:hypothetical protein